MPLGRWIKSLSGQQAPERNESMMVADSLLMELDGQLEEAADREHQREAGERRSRGGADYSWLSKSPATKVHAVSQLERIELEELCMKVKPEETTRIMTMFREALVRHPPGAEIPRHFRACVNQVLAGRPKEETMPEWVTKSLTSLNRFKPVSRKVTPLPHGDEQDDLEMQRTPETSVTTVSQTLVDFREKGSRSFSHFEVTSDHVHL